MTTADAGGADIAVAEPEHHPMVDISDLPAAVVLAALYNNQYVQGVGGRFAADGEMTILQAQSILTCDGPLLEKVQGRPIHIHFGAYSEGRLMFNPAMYDAERGEGAAATVIQSLKDALLDQLPLLIKDQQHALM